MKFYFREIAIIFRQKFYKSNSKKINQVAILHYYWAF